MNTTETQTSNTTEALPMDLCNTIHGGICALRGFAERNPDHPMAEDILSAWRSYEDSDFTNSAYADGCITRCRDWMNGPGYEKEPSTMSLPVRMVRLDEGEDEEGNA
jgi:hypothetical protein